MFRRGFKKWCEDQSLQYREQLGLKPYSPINPFEVADLFNIKVVNTDDIHGLSVKDRNNLLVQHSDAWSAVTISVDTISLIIVNSSHSDGRVNSSLAHELSHLILDHRPSPISVNSDGLLILNNYQKMQEDEANWMAGCLLLPRKALEHIKQNYSRDSSVAKKYGVSLDMLKWRLNISGVNKQYRSYSRS